MDECRLESGRSCDCCSSANKEIERVRERVRELEQLISDAYYYVPDSMNCAGYKCRLPQCSACYDQDEDSGVGDILARMQAVMEKGEE